MIGLRYIACVVLIGCASTKPAPIGASPAPAPVPARRSSPHEKSVAILGIEVIGSTVDPGTIATARDLTLALRERPRTHIGPYELRPDPTSVTDEILKYNCASKLPSCMSDIGNARGADMLVWGEIAKRPTGYEVTLSLLDVAAKSLVKTTTEVMAPNAAVDHAGVVFYKRLVGDTQVVLYIQVDNVDHGRVLVDAEVRGFIAEGRAKIANLPPGRYTIWIEADGVERIEKVVEIGRDDVVLRFEPHPRF